MKQNYKQVYLVLAVSLLVGLTVGFMLGVSWAQESSDDAPAIGQAEPKEIPSESKEIPETMIDPNNNHQLPVINRAALEEIIADFQIPDNARLSIIIHDLTNQERLLSFNGEATYPTASLYKLYLAYLAYEDIDNNLLTLDQHFIDHPYHWKLNLGACLNLMIEVSDSFCGEALLHHYGYSVIQSRLDQLGLSQIRSAAFQTSAEGMTRLLELIYGDSLSQESRSRLLTSMNNQAYEVILQPVFNNYGRVYDKTGTYRGSDSSGQRDNWIDVGIIELQDGDQVLAISVLQQNLALDSLQSLIQELAGVTQTGAD